MVGQLASRIIDADENSSYDEQGASYVWGKAGEWADMGGSVYPGIGHGIGALAGTIYGWATFDDQYDAQQKAKQDREYAARSAKYSTDSAALASVNTGGSGEGNYFKLGGKMYPRARYAMGGKLPVRAEIGGNVRKVAPSTKKVRSFTGKTDDVRLNNGAMVDHNELILDDEKVLSADLGYAQIGERLLALPEVKSDLKKYNKAQKIIQNADPTSLHDRNTAERLMETTKHPLEPLYQMQESNKGFAKGGNMYAEGGQFDWRYATLATDNIGNAILASQTPEVPTLERFKAMPLETRVDVSDQISAIDSSTASANRAIQAGTSSSSDAISRMMNVRAQNIGMKNKVYGEKNRLESILRNQNTLNAQGVANQNTGLANQEKMMELGRSTNMQEYASANLKNLSEDTSQIIATENQKAVDAERTQMYKSYFDKQDKNFYEFDKPHTSDKQVEADYMLEFLNNNPTATPEQAKKAYQYFLQSLKGLRFHKAVN